MIVTTKKNPAEVREALKPYRRIIILGCAECAAICRTGGSEEVEAMAKTLGAKHEVLATISIDSPCDRRLTHRGFRLLDKELAEAEAILALTCGSGVQAVAEDTGKPVIAALDTHFPGVVERLNAFYERCRHCGECKLNLTGGLCPESACPKSLLNGPCEGEHDGRCEIEGVGDCVWAAIRQRKENREIVYTPPRDWCLKSHPRQMVKDKEEK